MFNVRNIEAIDYSTLCVWWDFWRFPRPTKGMLPNGGLDGLMVCYNGVPLCAGFIYKTASDFAWSEFIVSNPDIKDKTIREDGLVMLLDSISVMCKSMGFKIVFSSVKNENLIKKYIKSGYTIGTKNTNELIKIL